jgi:hypothetical protein
MQSPQQENPKRLSARLDGNGIAQNSAARIPAAKIIVRGGTIRRIG